MEKGVSPLEIADEVASAVGDIFGIDKPARRDAELAAAIPRLEKLATTRTAQNLLESESGVLLNS
jgi:hypothetical protein